MINIHPSLLPAYRGLNTHERALADGIKIHGCTVHFVRHEVDQGPIIAQAAVPVRSEEHTSELQSQSNLVCRLLLEKKKNSDIHAMAVHAINATISKICVRFTA